MNTDRFAFPAIDESSTLWAAVTVLAGLLYIFSLFGWRSKESKYPWGRSYIRYGPRWLSGLIWSLSSRDVMKAAYEKFRQGAFRIARHDVNLVMLPPSAVDEVSALPSDVASNLHALEHDLVSHFTGLGYLRDARLHARFVHRRITPNLPFLAAGIDEEVSTAIAELFDAKGQDWTEISPYPMLTTISSRVSARIMLGSDYCRNQEWLNIAIKFTENFLGSVVIMRYFPNWMHHILQYILPTVWATRYYLRRADRFLSPEFDKLLRMRDEGTLKPSQREEAWGLENLVELATENERDVRTLVQAEILLILASIPTTVFSEVNVLFDLMANPHLINLVRDEVNAVNKDQWSVSSYGRLHKLDSILRESQRLAPPTLIGMRRIMKRDHTLSSGILLSKGSYICIPSYTIQNDTQNTRNPTEYDGLRSYNKRLGQDGEVESTKHQFVTTESTVLGFGHNRTACPGRWLASIALKIIISKLITEFDFKFPNGKEARPQNSLAHEFLVADQKARILIRRRKVDVPLF